MHWTQASHAIFALVFEGVRHYIGGMREKIGYQTSMRQAHSRVAFAALDNLIANHYIQSMREKTMTNELAQYIAKRNAETLAWIAEDPDNRWAGLIVDDLAFWAEQGILTVKDFNRHNLECTIWDLYRDVFGTRPRHMDFKSMSYEELERECDLLGKMLENEIKREEEWQAQEMAYIQEQAEEENAARAEMPEKIDYVAANYQDGWL